MLGDLSSRRAQIKNIEGQESIQVVRALIPLAETFAYTTTLPLHYTGKGQLHHGIPLLREGAREYNAEHTTWLAGCEDPVTTRQKIRIVLRAFDHRSLDVSAGQIVETAERTGAMVAGPVPLPTQIRRFCVIRSPHVDKDSREHFEIRTHKRLIDILDPTSKTIDALDEAEFASGVDISIKL